MGYRPLRIKIWQGCPPWVLLPPPNRTQSWRPCFPGCREHRAGGVHTSQSRALTAGWLVFSARAVARDHAPPWFFSSGGARGADKVVDGPFFGQKPLVSSSILTTLDGGVARGLHRHSPGGESGRSGLVPVKRRTWRNRPHLPSKLVGPRELLVAKAYSAAGQAASALHAMVILQVHQAKALKTMQAVGPTRDWWSSCAWRRLRSPGRRKSQRGPSGRWCPHLWPKCAIYGSTWPRWEMSTKCAFLTLPSPSWAIRRHCRGLSPAVLGSTKADWGYPAHPAPAWSSSCHRSTAGHASACLSPRVPFCGLQNCFRPMPRPHRGQRGEPHAGAWCLLCLSRPLSHPGRWWSGLDTDGPEIARNCSSDGNGEHSATPSPEGGPDRESLVSVCFLFRHWPKAQGPQGPVPNVGNPFSKKEQFPSSYSGTSASWGIGSNGKRASSPLCRGSLFSVWSQTLRVWRHVSPTSAPSQCWTAWVPSKAGQCFHWNIFRSSWGIWPQPYHPAAQDRLPTKLSRAETGQYLDGRPPGKTRLVLVEVLVRPAGGAHPAVCVGPKAPV